MHTYIYIHTYIHTRTTYSTTYKKDYTDHTCIHPHGDTHTHTNTHIHTRIQNKSSHYKTNLSKNLGQLIVLFMKNKRKMHHGTITHGSNSVLKVLVSLCRNTCTDCVFFLSRAGCRLGTSFGAKKGSPYASQGCWWFA
jgi:hypothetical protein